MLTPDQMLAIVIFVVAYIFIIFFYEHKLAVVILSILTLILTKAMTIGQAFQAISWNVILLYFGMLFVSEVFLWSKIPDYLAVKFTSKTKSVGMAMLVICIFSSALSLFLENVAVVLLVAPIALAISKRLGINPVPLFIGIAITSNLQGVGTLIGDPPSMLLGSYARLNFNDFFFLHGKPGIFFAVQIGASVSLLILYWFFKRYDHKMPHIKEKKYLSIVPGMFVLFLVLSLIFSSFVKTRITYLAGLICLIFGAISFAWYLWHTKDKNPVDFLLKLDWQTGFFLIGIFMLVRSLEVTGLMEVIANAILSYSGHSTFLTYIILVWLAVFISAFVDNVPFLVAMLPVTKIITESLGASPYLFYFGLLIGVSVGGNITPIGASANIVAMGIMKKEGHDVKFFEFVKMGLPFTIAATLASSMFIWLVFS